jgi:erythronate-4-phosphate dehydrogenase
MKNRPLNIVVNRNTPSVVEAFSHIGKVIALDTKEVTKDAVRDADILIVRSETRVDRDLLEGSSVRFVGTVTIGTDHVDTDYLASKGIRFVSAPGSNANSVAEYLAAALLVWGERTGKTLRGKTIGIVGVGNVGSRVVKVAKAFGMNVLLNDPPLARKEGGSSYRPLDELMDADIVTLHVPLTKSGPDSTYHFFDEERIRNMKRGAVLINTARGAVVDTKALSDALASKHLSAAIIDVWENEPTIDVGLMDQVMLATPHIAGYSLDGKLSALSLVYEEVCRFLNVPVEWSIKTTAEDSDGGAIAIPDDITDEQKALRAIMRQAYDIELDDRTLRQATGIAENDRGSYFMKLRAEYRVRREFFNRAVRLPPRQEALRNILNGLGFKTEMQNEQQWVG